MAKQYKSDALAAAHETALGLAEAGVMAKRTMRAFDDLCLTPVEDPRREPAGPRARVPAMGCAHGRPPQTSVRRRHARTVHRQRDLSEQGSRRAIF